MSGNLKFNGEPIGEKPTYENLPAHGTLSGFVDSDCRCICCCTAFNAYLQEERNLLIFAPDYPWARAWAAKLNLNPMGYIYIHSGYQFHKIIQGRTSGYYVMLGGVGIPTGWRDLIRMSNLKELAG